MRGLLSRGNELTEQPPVVRVGVQVLLRDIERAQLVNGVIVARGIVELEALGESLLGVSLEQRLRVTLGVKRGPHFLSLLPLVRVESLAEHVPLVVHLGYLVIKSASLSRLQLAQLLICLVSFLLDRRDGSLSGSNLRLHELVLCVHADQLVRALEHFSHAHEAHVGARLRGLASDRAVSVLSLRSLQSLLGEKVGRLVVGVHDFLFLLLGRGNRLLFDLRLLFVEDNGIHRRPNVSRILISVDNSEHAGVPLLGVNVAVDVDLLALLKLKQSSLEPRALLGLSADKNKAVVLAMILMSMMLGLHCRCEQKRNYILFHCF